jgi:hypothetical protein
MLSSGNTSFDLISDARYDNVADGRITAVPEPSAWLSFGMLSVAAVVMLGHRQRVARGESFH